MENATCVTKFVKNYTSFCLLGFLNTARQAVDQVLPPTPDKSKAVPLTGRWSPQLTARADRFMFGGRPEPAAAPDQDAAHQRGSDFEGQRETHDC